MRVRSQLTAGSPPVSSTVVTTAESDDGKAREVAVVVSFVGDSVEILRLLVVFWTESSTSPRLHFSKTEGDNVITEYWLQ